MSTSTASPWLRSAPYDLGFFVASGFATLLLVLAYPLFGPGCVAPIFGIHVAFFSLPHHFLTWSALAPARVRRLNAQPLVLGLIAVSLAWCAAIPLTRGAAVNDWLLTALALLAIWHLYRQHHGICKVYDAVQARRFQDPSIFVDRTSSNVLLALGSFSMLVWLFTHERLEYRLSETDHYTIIHPVLPYVVFQVYVALMVVAALWTLERCVLARRRAGKHVPWPQLAIVATATLVSGLPFFVVPTSAIPLVIAIASLYHIVQYFGFVWLFERHRSAVLAEDRAAPALAWPQRSALEGRWRTYFGAAFAYSAALLVIYFLDPQRIGLVLIYVSNVAHYLVDGVIWSGRRNRSIGPSVAHIASAG